MKTEITYTPIDQIRVNLNNPRTIKEERFKQLVKSVQRSPWMLKLRPIVVDEDGIILGGNQRFKACVESGFSHVWVIWAKDISDEQKKRFILRDNIDFGKWDLEIIRQQYSEQELLDYGSQISLLEDSTLTDGSDVKPPPPMGDDEALEPDIDDDVLEESKKNFNDSSIKQIVFQLPDELYEKTLKQMDEISKEMDLDDNSEVFLHLINFYEVSHGLSNSDNDSI